MRVIVKNSDGTKKVYDGSNGICLVLFDKEELTEAKKLFETMEQDRQNDTLSASIVLADSELYSEEEVYSMVDSVNEEIKETGQIQDDGTADEEISEYGYSPKDQPVRHELLEFRFHKSRRDGDIDDLCILAQQYPQEFGLAVNEYIRNVHNARIKLTRNVA